MTREQELALIEAALNGPRHIRITPEMARAYDEASIERTFGRQRALWPGEKHFFLSNSMSIRGRRGRKRKAKPEEES